MGEDVFLLPLNFFYFLILFFVLNIFFVFLGQLPCLKRDIFSLEDILYVFRGIKMFKNLTYINLYNMPKDINLINHSPKLESVLMVERTIEKYSSEYTIYQLWKKLPKKMMYQTYKVILDYLESSRKIIIDKDNTLIWIFDEKNIKKIISKDVKLR